MSSSDSESDSKSNSESDAPPPPPPKRARKQAPSRNTPSVPSFDDAEFLGDTNTGEGVQVDGEEKKNRFGVRRTDGTNLVGPAGNVGWHKQTKKYQAQAKDRVTGKNVSAGLHETKEAARAAVRAKQAALDEAYEATDVFQAALKATEGLPPSPDKIEEAEFGKTYRHQDAKNKFVPYGAVVSRAGKEGLVWTPACAHVDPATGATWTCGKKARQAQKGEPKRFCFTHGGRCAHSASWIKCRECNPKAAQGADNCGSCAKRMSRGRLVRNGGSGYCCDCEPVVNAQAAAAGAAPLPKGKRTEDVCFEVIQPLIVDENGWEISAELEDNHKFMLGAINKNGRRTRGVGGDCDTTTIRRPDRLYTLRNKDARLVAVLALECDEDSHGPRDSACEAGKIDDSFQSLCKRAQEEGMARLATFAMAHEHMPYFLTIKFNPDACDARDADGNKLNIPRQRRLEVVAELAREFLNRPASYYEELAAEGQTMVPHVRTLYYYSKSKHLDYFAEKAAGAWDWQGNACPV